MDDQPDSKTRGMHLQAKGIFVSGKFTEADFQELLATIRNIEQRHTEVNYKVVVTDNDMQLSDALAMMKRTFPYVPGREAFFVGIENEPQAEKVSGSKLADLVQEAD